MMFHARQFFSIFMMLCGAAVGAEFPEGMFPDDAPRAAQRQRVQGPRGAHALAQEDQFPPDTPIPMREDQPMGVDERGPSIKALLFGLQRVTVSEDDRVRSQQSSSAPPADRRALTLPQAPSQRGSVRPLSYAERRALEGQTGILVASPKKRQIVRGLWGRGRGRGRGHRGGRGFFDQGPSQRMKAPAKGHLRGRGRTAPRDVKRAPVFKEPQQ